MTLADLIPETVPVQVDGSLDVPVTQLAYDSRRVQPGAVFFALAGSKTNGSIFIDQALKQGAVAVVVEQQELSQLRQRLTSSASQFPSVTLLSCSSPRVLLGLMADRFFQQPSGELTLIGVTGTSGKTTTTYLLEAIWQAMGRSAGVIGTVNYRYQGREEPAPFTTPEAVDLQSLLCAMVSADVTHAVMEVSSHALVQERVRGCQWDGAVFTNLGRDHLDFHTDLDDYFAAKARLFISELAESPKANRFAVVNTDDLWGEKLLTYRLPGRVLTYGLADRAGVSVRNIEQSFSGMRGTLCLEGKDIAFSSRLIGEPHVYNILAAAATAHALDISAEAIVAGLAQCTGVPGRLETIKMGQDFAVIVDYAHKPNALEKTLHSVRQLTQQRLITVFGCGGDRDTGKRPLMGEAAGRLSDVVIVTSDNPRTEDPQRILLDAEQGLIQTDLRRVEDLTQAATIAELQRGYLVVADRREAIHAALRGARAGDVVVIAGKGHEDYQIIGTTKHHFDDREEVRQYFLSQEVV